MANRIGIIGNLFENPTQPALRLRVIGEFYSDDYTAVETECQNLLGKFIRCTKRRNKAILSESKGISLPWTMVNPVIRNWIYLMEVLVIYSEDDVHSNTFSNEYCCCKLR
ncbi:hypothetical protein NPIL_139771 [Nephila pilipes]|uniref:Uncharacterized protein n=1 Tax=Nephila pilipes TaxID=299642 RepID=A0A8X6ND56_NEPPI|nr:hypothetical protein NPIL_139771 [Nephila pilipes]